MMLYLLAKETAKKPSRVQYRCKKCQKTERKERLVGIFLSTTFLLTICLFMQPLQLPVSNAAALFDHLTKYAS
ncbi:hypothetical protein DPMN_081697 [Dreissena polymorpha]|uniref:Uncharacterized protein n=1 Tax=Dreissena polymorpha TaxID=45954 RepID=A0A9D3Y6S6_DREPO|nr:hypothetical protein DPMN_081697 [Dreissena polymorpha]